jgi:hypothetical protein
VACGPNVAILGLELLSLRGRYQPEIVFGVLEIILRSDRVAGRVNVAERASEFCGVETFDALAGRNRKVSRSA